MEFDSAAYLSPRPSSMSVAAHDRAHPFVITPELSFASASVLPGEDYFLYNQVTDTLQLGSASDGPLDRATAEDSEHSDFRRQSTEDSNMTWDSQGISSDVTLDGWCVDRDGTPQTVKDYPGNSKITRPDDKIHAELRTSQDIILLLSDPATEHYSSKFRGSCWKGQLNGRNQFKVVYPSENCEYRAPNMRLLVYIDSIARCLDFKTDMRHTILSISGHLAIEVKKNESIKVALMLPPNMPVTSDFRIVIGIASDLESDASISATACKESFLTLSDCALPMRFTTKYPVRPRKLSARARSYGTAGSFQNEAESSDIL